MPSIETLLGHSADDIEKMSDEELFKAFPDIFNFEKSLRENASLLTPEKPSKPDADDSEVSIGTTTTSVSKVVKQTKRADERKAAMLELLQLSKSLGVKIPGGNNSSSSAPIKPVV